MSKEKAVIYEVRDRIGWITLNRPEKRNAINQAMLEEVYEAYADVKNNPDVWSAIITGKGPVFCAGKDLVDKTGPQNPNAPTNDDLYAFQRTVFKPIIAALNGPCLAQGGGFTFSADIVIMSERASIGWPQVKRGISSVSGPSMFAQSVPWTQAMAYLMRGIPVPAEECLRLGLANEVVPHDALLTTAERWAREIQENAPLAVQAVKEAARRGQNLPVETRQYMARDIADRILHSEDAKEGLLAFKEKRKPVWVGR